MTSETGWAAWSNPPIAPPSSITLLQFGTGRFAPSDGWLTDAERQRARALRTQAMSGRFRAAHAALRAALGRAVDRHPMSLEIRAGKNGKPELDASPSVHFNLSHSGDQAIVAIGPQPLGVDLEAVAARLGDDESLAAWILDSLALETWRTLDRSTRASELCRAWTLKEAFLKARGSGLGDEALATYSLPEGGFGPMAADPSQSQFWWVKPIAAPAGYRAALGTLGAPAPVKIFRLMDTGWRLISQIH